MASRLARNRRLAALAGVLALAGCAQPFPSAPLGASAAASWIAPDAGGKNLLYVSYGSSVLVFDYGTSNQVGQLSYFSEAAGSCTDASGDVYVTNYGAADVIEFAHGASKPMKTLIDPSPYPVDCAVDPATGNLAVINEYGRSEYAPGNVAIYTAAKGTPKTYKIKGFTTYVSGSYDASGDLLVSDTQSSRIGFAMLARGSRTFKAVTLPQRANFKYPGYVRWDGEYYVVDFEFFGVTIFEWYTIKNYEGSEEGYMETEESGEVCTAFWLGRIGAPKSVRRANQLVAGTGEGILGWNYPHGGSYVFQIYDYSEARGVTASTAR